MVVVVVSLTLTINQFDPGVSLGDKFSAFRNCNAELEGGSDFSSLARIVYETISFRRTDVTQRRVSKTCLQEFAFVQSGLGWTAMVVKSILIVSFIFLIFIVINKIKLTARYLNCFRFPQMPTEDNRYNYSEKGVAQLNTDEQSMNIRTCMMMMIMTMMLMVVIQSR